MGNNEFKYNKASDLFLEPSKNIKEMVKIPYGVPNIDNKAFSSCTCLTSIEIPNSVKSICVSAFLVSFQG